MNTFSKPFFYFLLFCNCLLFGQKNSPVNTNATPEARNLLKYIYSISGKHTLTALHEQLYQMSINTDSVKFKYGKLPAIWGGEFGFADERHDVDNIKYRPALLEEIFKQYKSGAIITLTYHQASPARGEPCLFKPGVLDTLSKSQFNDLLTPGTAMYSSWLTMTSKLADMLEVLQKNNIPVLFRPYHEMNGGWFWWSGKRGDSCYIKLYKQMYDYLTYTRKLNNLIWVWTPSNQNFYLSEYFPGKEYVDILGFDIYPPFKGAPVEEIFKQAAYDTLYSFAKGKPICIGECSIMPTLEILEKQTNWVWMMPWVGSIFQNTNEQIIKLYNSEKVITRDEVKIK